MATIISTLLLFLRVDLRPRWGHILPAFALMLCACSVVIEGYRWQMEGAYVVAVLLFAVSAKRLKNFLEVSVGLMQVMARACGHDHLSGFTREDLTTWKKEMADLAGIPYGGLA